MIEAQPSRTALRVALRRAAHQVVDQPPLVFPDPFALPIVGPQAAEELRRTPDGNRKPHSAALRAWMVARARFAEDVLGAAATSATALQYLVLGAGLDTFALRNPFPHVLTFEVDHPATQAWKHERLREAHFSLPRTATFVPVDFEQDDLLSSLLRSGFNPELPTVTAWLGVVPYLTAAAFEASCRVLGRFARGSHVIFDYGQPREVLSPVEQLMHDSLSARVAQAGEPFQLFFTPEALAARLRPLHLVVEEDLGSVELNRLYFGGRSDGLQVRGSGGRLCHALTRT